MEEGWLLSKGTSGNPTSIQGYVGNILLQVHCRNLRKNKPLSSYIGQCMIYVQLLKL